MKKEMKEREKCKEEGVSNRKSEIWILHATVKLGGNEIWNWWNGLFTKNANRTLISFFPLDISVLTTPFSSPKVSLRTSSTGEKHWAVLFPPLKLKTCLLALNGTLCASLLVFEWVWGHTETRLGPVLQWEGRTRYLPKRWIHWGLEWNRKPCPRPESSDAPSAYMQDLRRTACLAPDDVFLSAAAAVRKYHSLN